jgi:L-amino acid N-acyltransferase YncA
MSTVIRVRPAELADAEAIAGIFVRSWQGNYRGLIPREYLDRMSPAELRPAWERQLAGMSWPRKVILTAEVGGRVAGFVGFCPTRDRDDDPETVVEFFALFLAPEAQGAGVGRRLMSSAFDTLAQTGYEQATGWVIEGNHGGRRFHESLGWYHDGAVKHDETRGFSLTAIRYRRALDRSNSITSPT